MFEKSRPRASHVPAWATIDNGYRPVLRISTNSGRDTEVNPYFLAKLDTLGLNYSYGVIRGSKPIYTQPSLRGACWITETQNKHAEHGLIVATKHKTPQNEDSRIFMKPSPYDSLSFGILDYETLKEIHPEEVAFHTETYRASNVREVVSGLFSFMGISINKIKQYRQ